MTFEDLPQNFRDLSLDDPVLRADAVDLFVGQADREDGCLAIVLLDEEHRVVQPCVITDMGPADPKTLPRAVRLFLGEVHPPAIVAALGRAGSPLFTDLDRQCHQVLVDVCREAGVDLLGFFVATAAALREMPDHLRAAS